MSTESRDRAPEALFGAATSANEDPQSREPSLATAVASTAYEPYEPTLGQLLAAYIAEHAVP